MDHMRFRQWRAILCFAIVDVVQLFSPTSTLQQFPFLITVVAEQYRTSVEEVENENEPTTAPEKLPREITFLFTDSHGRLALQHGCMCDGGANIYTIPNAYRQFAQSWRGMQWHRWWDGTEDRYFYPHRNGVVCERDSLAYEARARRRRRKRGTARRGDYDSGGPRGKNHASSSAEDENRSARTGDINSSANTRSSSTGLVLEGAAPGDHDGQGLQSALLKGDQNKGKRRKEKNAEHDDFLLEEDLDDHYLVNSVMNMTHFQHRLPSKYPWLAALQPWVCVVRKKRKESGAYLDITVAFWMAVGTRPFRPSFLLSLKKLFNVGTRERGDPDLVLDKQNGASMDVLSWYRENFFPFLRELLAMLIIPVVPGRGQDEAKDIVRKPTNNNARYNLLPPAAAAGPGAPPAPASPSPVVPPQRNSVVRAVFSLDSIFLAWLRFYPHFVRVAEETKRGVEIVRPPQKEPRGAVDPFYQHVVDVLEEAYEFEACGTNRTGKPVEVDAVAEKSWPREQVSAINKADQQHTVANSSAISSSAVLVRHDPTSGQRRGREVQVVHAALSPSCEKNSAVVRASQYGNMFRRGLPGTRPTRIETGVRAEVLSFLDSDYKFEQGRQSQSMRVVPGNKRNDDEFSRNKVSFASRERYLRLHPHRHGAGVLSAFALNFTRLVFDFEAFFAEHLDDGLLFNANHSAARNATFLPEIVIMNTHRHLPRYAWLRSENSSCKGLDSAGRVSEQELRRTTHYWGHFSPVHATVLGMVQAVNDWRSGSDTTSNSARSNENYSVSPERSRRPWEWLDFNAKFNQLVSLHRRNEADYSAGTSAENLRPTPAGWMLPVSACNKSHLFELDGHHLGPWASSYHYQLMKQSRTPVE
ncbi:unnamed protein product [Amoebophrya sp. A120]|nr:unnamed protein product [Amoebophrya sp. A120]|eukprot:GSA120T00001589001.1